MMRRQPRAGARRSRPGAMTSAAAISATPTGTVARTAREAPPANGAATNCPRSERTAVQAEYDGPPIPDDITGNELDRVVTNQLKSLPEKLAARVARHLVAAARLLDSDPETAYQHTLAARARAARVAIVREACGEAAYAAGRFKEALTEFKAARRMSGNAMYLPMMADCERALGRPERALALATRTRGDRPRRCRADRDEDRRVRRASRSRRNRGGRSDPRGTRAAEPLAGVVGSAGCATRMPTRLLADGQPEAAREWFERAAGVDAEGYTDAAERLAELDGTHRRRHARRRRAGLTAAPWSPSSPGSQSPVAMHSVAWWSRR